MRDSQPGWNVWTRVDDRPSGIIQISPPHRFPPAIQASSSKRFKLFPQSLSLNILMLAITASVSLLSQANVYAADMKDASTQAIPETIYHGTITQLAVTPAEIQLDGKLDARKVLVLGKTPSGQWVDLSRQARFAFDADKKSTPIAKRTSDGFLMAIADGSSIVKVTAAGITADLKVNVRHFSNVPSVSFTRDVMPILSKADCNSGPCHGTPKGKNGFKLSLRGYDPEWDHEQLIEDLSSRRLNRSHPHDSLMLIKPTGQAPHVGGARFAEESREYQTLYRWILEGNPSDVGKVTRANRLTVLPPSPVLPEIGMVQDIIVLAHYPDGSTRDVTREAVYQSSRDFIAKVDANGHIQGIRRGESALIVRYEGNYAVNYVSVLGSDPSYKWNEIPSHNFVDDLVYQKLQKLKLNVSRLTTDEEFLRRVSLDIIGLPPSPEELKAFVADKTETKLKREKVVDQLLDRPEFVDRWSHKWADLLQCNRKHLGDRATWAFRNWLREQVAKDRPINEFVHELMTASGSSIENPAANYFVVCKEPLVAMENMTQLFLGIRFACNKCHDHPFERWTQGQHYELGAFFAKVGRKPGMRAGEMVIFDSEDAGQEVKHPRTGQVMPARFPYAVQIAAAKAAPTMQKRGGPNAHGETVQQDAPTSREELADWLTSPDNPYFAKSVANRFWSYFMGAGIIDPPDDVRSSNPPSNPQLLDALTKDFVQNNFSIRKLIRTITTSRTYQIAIDSTPNNVDDTLNFSHALPRRLSAEQLEDAVSRALGVPISFEGLPAGFRASQLPDSQVKSEFLDEFGRPPRESACECERTTTVSLKQAMNLVNGQVIGDALANPNNRISKMVQNKRPVKEIVQEIYFSILCKTPTEQELAEGVKYLSSKSVPLSESAQDLSWALLNSPAFLFNR